MRISDCRYEEHGRRLRLAATISFDVVDRPPINVHYEHLGPGWPEPRVEPFVATAAIVADAVGETEMVVEHPVDPRVPCNVRAAVSLLRGWWPQGRPHMRWTTTDRTPVRSAGGTAFCLTGGVDSTALLILNHETFPVGHPFRIDTGMVVYGLDDSTDGDVEAPDGFLCELAERFGIAVRGVRTNIRQLDPSTRAWADRIQAAVLTGAAHAALVDSGALLIAPSDSSESLMPYGTHHSLDHRFSSTELRVVHEHVGEDRVERVRLVASRPELLPLVQVCNRPRAEWGQGTLNCGRCEKCVRTMVCFRAVGVGELPSFAVPTVSPSQVDALPTPKSLPDWWADYLPDLRERGEGELAAAVERYLRRSERRQRVRAAVHAARRWRDAVIRR